MGWKNEIQFSLGLTLPPYSTPFWDPPIQEVPYDAYWREESKTAEG